MFKESESNLENLTELRVDHVLQVTSAILEASKCDLVRDNNDLSNENFKAVFVSSKSNNIQPNQVLVGPVLMNRKSGSKNQSINTYEYRRYGHLKLFFEFLM